MNDYDYEAEEREIIDAEVERDLDDMEAEADDSSGFTRTAYTVADYMIQQWIREELDAEEAAYWDDDDPYGDEDEEV